MWHDILVIAVFVGGSWLAALLLYKLLVWRIKHKLYKNAPRVEMVMCDKGHYYPKDLAFTLEVPEVPFPVELCPICYDKNLTNAQAILKLHEEQDADTKTN